MRLCPKFILESRHEQGSIPAIFPAIPGTPGESPPGSLSSGEKRDAALSGTPDFWDTPALRDLKSRLRSRYHLVYSDGSGVSVYELN